MRILFTTAWYPNRKVAGDGVFIQKHARAVALLNDVAVLMVQTDESKHDHRIELCAKDASGDLPSECEGALHEVLVYVPKTRWEVPAITGLVRMFWLMAGYLKGYRYIVKHFWMGKRPDVSHVNVLTRAAGLPWLLKKVYGVPYIITEHWSRYMREGAYPNSGLQLLLGRLFVKDASYVCPVSYNLEKGMKEWKLENRHYTRIGNVVDTDVFCLPEESDGRSIRQSGKVSFVHVSWMRDDSKNISGILRVMARLRQVRNDFSLRLVGEGNDKPQLIAYAEQLGLLPEVVTFVDAKQGEELSNELCANDALLMFSNFENQPVSVLEALACGLPVIATAVGAIPAMLAQKRGITVKAGDEEELYKVMDSFLTIRSKMNREQLADRKMAQLRRDYVVSKHGPAVIARQFDVLYQASRAASD